MRRSFANHSLPDSDNVVICSTNATSALFVSVVMRVKKKTDLAPQAGQCDSDKIPAAVARSLFCAERSKAKKKPDSSDEVGATAGKHAPSQLVTRRDISADCRWSERTTARLEKRGLLQPLILLGKKFYLREDVDRLVRESKASLSPGEKEVWR